MASLGGVQHGLYAEQWAPFVKVPSLPRPPFSAQQLPLSHPGC